MIGHDWYGRMHYIGIDVLLNVYLGNIRLKLLVELFELVILLFNFISRYRLAAHVVSKFNVEIRMRCGIINTSKCQLIYFAI